MNDNLYNPAAIGSNQPSALNANSGFSPRHFELDGYGLSRCFDDFFDKCKKINDDVLLKPGLENFEHYFTSG